MTNLPLDQQLYDEVKELVKSRVKVWPSAYASGQLVKEYKKIFSEIYGPDISAYLASDGASNNKNSRSSGKSGNSMLSRWFDEVWVNVCEKDEYGNYMPCGRISSNLEKGSYPYCRPLYRISENTPKTVQEFTSEELDMMCKQKRSKTQGINKRPTRIYHSKLLATKKS
jgi:hypothetical protein